MKFRDSTIIMAVTGFYMTCLIVANMTAGKMFDFFGVAISVGAFAYMACIGSSDILVDIYGPKVGYKLVGIGAVMNVVVLGFYQIALHLPAMPGQEWIQPSFEAVFASSTSVIVGSLLSYPITETFEVFFWTKLKSLTDRRHMWFRNSLVPIVSQFIDATIFFNLAFFIVPSLLYKEPLIPMSEWQQVMVGAWLYGLWKGVLLGTLDYPAMRMIIPWLRKHRIPDIPSLDPVVQEEEWKGAW